MCAMYTRGEGMVMERLATNSKDYHGACCYGDLLHVVWKATCLLILLPTSNPTVAAAASDDFSYYLPSSNVNDSLFSYSNDKVSYILQSIGTGLPVTSLNSCNNDLDILEDLSSQERLYGRSAGVSSFNFELYFVISVDEICTRNNDSTPSYYLSLLAYNENSAQQDLNRAKVVWTANVGKPVGENACLQLSPDDSNLRLVDYDRNGSVVWETNTPGYTNATLTITFEGNLVLYTNVSTDPSDSTTLQQQILWQSYEQPTDTLMVLEALRPGMNLTAASTTESTNKTAIYTLAIDKNGTLALYTKIQYKALNNNTSNSSTDYSEYVHPYFFWSPNDTQPMNGSYDHAAAVLCWSPDNRSSLQLDIVQSEINGLVLLICKEFPSPYSSYVYSS